MINRGSNLKVVSGKLAIAALGLYYALFFLIYASPLGTFFLKKIPLDMVPDLMKSGYNSVDLSAFFDALSTDGLSDYIRNLWTIDLLLPFLAFLSSVLLLCFCLQRIGISQQWNILFLIVPLIILLCDYSENSILTYAALTHPGTISGSLVYTSSLLTKVKWLGISAVLFLEIVLVSVFVVILTVRKKRKS